jgi:hypothetical protein
MTTLIFLGAHNQPAQKSHLINISNFKKLTNSKMVYVLAAIIGAGGFLI